MQTIKVLPAGGIEGNEVEYKAESLLDFVIEIDGHELRCAYRQGRLIIPYWQVESFNVTYLPNSTYPALALNLK